MPAPSEQEQLERLIALREAMELAKTRYEFAKKQYDRLQKPTKEVIAAPIGEVTHLYTSCLQRYKGATLDFNSYLLAHTFPEAAKTSGAKG